MRKTIVAYFPVIHRGVINFINTFSDHMVLLLGNDVLDRLSLGEEGILSLRRDPRIIQEVEMVNLVNAIRSKVSNQDTRVLRLDNIKYLDGVEEIVMPDEDVTRLFAQKFLSKFKGKIIYSQTFLRWDMPKSLSEIPPNCDTTIHINDLKKIGLSIFVEKAFEVSSKSSDWWRQVGAIMIKDGKVILAAYNHHLPTEYQPYIYGDPRSNFDAGKCIELSTAGHAEATIVAEAASRGISTRGSDIYVTTFPCPPCAKQVAHARFKRLFFVEGYSNLNSVETLKSFGVKIIHVQR